MLNKKFIFSFILLGIIFSSFYVFAADNLNEVTQERALEALNDSQRVISEMQINNFSIVYVNDTFLEAEIVFEQAKYAEILRTSNSSYVDIARAKTALKLVNWKLINYSSVFIYTNEISTRRNLAFQIQDSITAFELKLANYYVQKVNVSEAENLFSQAKLAFYEDRYDEAQNLLKKASDSLELNASELNVFNSLRNNSLSFIRRNWIYILGFLILFSFIFYFSYSKMNKSLLEKKIKKLKKEQIVLHNLIKKAQEDRFKKNEISGLVYNIKLKKYTEKIEKIKEELPVLESRLGKI